VAGFGNARVAVGGPGCRYRGTLRWVIHGTKHAHGNPTDDPSNDRSASSVPTKGIVVSGAGSALDLHGREQARTWTWLSLSARTGDSRVHL